MRFDAAVKKFQGDSVGGQLIVYRDGTHVLLGRHHDGYLIVEDTPEAQAILKAGGVEDDGEAEADAKPRKTRGKAAASAPEPEPEPTEPEPEPVHHHVAVDDEVITSEKLDA